MTFLRASLVASLLLASPLLAGEIHDAAARGDLPLLQALAARGPAARASTDADGLTALHHAVIRRRPEAVAILIATGAPLDAADREGRTPLHHLAHSVEESVVENFQRSGGGKFSDALAQLTQSGQALTPASLLGLLRADLAEVEEPLKLLRNFAAASTPEQMAVELKCAQALLAAGANVNALDRERSTPLHQAATSPRPDLARALIEAGAKVNAQSSPGLTPLHQAALFGSPETVEYLLAQGADPEGRAVLIGVPPLLMAVLRNEPRTVTLLLDHRADVNSLGPNGETALARAAALGATEIARLLIERGARVMVRFSRVNQTPLHAAAARGVTPLVQLLLEHKADPGAKDSAGLTPLHRAAEQGHTFIIRTLLLAGAGVNSPNALRRTALWLAASRGHAESVAYLLNHEADPALTATDGQTPLHIAAFNGRPDTVRLLLDRRPSLRSLSVLGTPLHSAAAGPTLRAIIASQAKAGPRPTSGGTPAESAACARMLVEAGAPLDVVNSQGASAMQLAAAFGNQEVLAALGKKQSSEWTARDAQGLTPLHHAARGPILPGSTPDEPPTLPAEILAECSQAIGLLLARGGTVGARDGAGLTPLHHAASAGNLPALEQLLAAKADPRTPDLAGNSPLHLAAAAGHPATARRLLAAGADPNLPNLRGETALSAAETHHHPEIASLLRSKSAKPVPGP